MIFIGVDGGGTKTAAAAYENGREIARAVSGPMNYNFVGVETAAENLLEAIRNLNIPMEKVGAVGVGDPSIDEGMPEGELLKQFVSAAREKLRCPVFVRSDAYMTLFGLGRRPAVLTISGTGAMSAAEDADGNIFTAGGWGRLTGDEGSGYYIALESIRAALHAADGLAPETLLLPAVLCYFGVSEPRDLINVFYGENCPDIAGFAEKAAVCAEKGDAAALAVLKAAAGHLAACTLRLVEKSGADTVGVYGSVLCRNRTVREDFEKLIHEKYPRIIITEPSVSASEAAARYAEMMYRR